MIHFDYLQYSDQISIFRYYGYAASVTIPSEIDDFPVTFIEDFAFAEEDGISEDIDDFLLAGVSQNAKLKSFRKTIKGPQYDCLDRYRKLKSVQLPEGLIAIGNCVFRNCRELEIAVIPDSVTSIGEAAFEGCENLTIYGMAGSLAQQYAKRHRIAFSVISEPYIDEFEVLFSMGSRRLIRCPEKLCGEYVVPDGITSIEENAFCDCRDLKSVFLPESLTNIGARAFAGCSRLTSIKLPSGVRYIGRETFWDCTSLTSITIPETVIYIDDQVFRHIHDVTIIGKPGSEAERYAKKENIRFQELE